MAAKKKRHKKKVTRATPAPYKSAEADRGFIAVVESYGAARAQRYLVKKDNGRLAPGEYYPYRHELLEDGLFAKHYETELHEIRRLLKSPKKRFKTADYRAAFGALAPHIMAKMKGHKRKVPRTAIGLTRMPAPWNNTTDKLKGIYFQFAADSYTNSYAFSLNLGEKLQALARGKGAKAADYLHRHIARYLKQGLGRKVEFWFAIEATKSGRPHLHGAVVLRTHEMLRAREILKRASWVKRPGGKRYAADLKHFQVSIRERELQTTLNWACYACKRLDSVHKPVKGKLLTATQGLRWRARAIFANDSAVVRRYVIPTPRRKLRQAFGLARP